MQSLLELRNAVTGAPHQPFVHASVIDLFCGCGALSYGFRQEGFRVACGFDIDESCRFPFETNVEAPFLRCDVQELSKQDVVREFHANEPTVLVGCAPCQPFSSYTKPKHSKNWQLLDVFGRLVAETKPHLISMENVPRLVQFQGGSVFNSFVNQLIRTNYAVNWGIVYGPAFGLPQARTRLVLLASRLGSAPSLPVGLIPPADYRSVHDAIGDLPCLRAGEANEFDPLHKCSNLSALNRARIQASVPGGTWEDWSPKLVAKCHRATSGATYKSVYGRMRWDRPSPTLTTQFYGYGRGRFGHPAQDRALSLREGADLQSFPRNYQFLPNGEVPSMVRIGRQIGNAVPVLLARAIARSLADHLAEVQG